MNPSNTLNKYVYAANNPLRYYDSNGEDITVFYRRGAWDTGHVLMVAVNQNTGSAAALDYLPNRDVTFPGQKVAPLAPQLVTPDRLREHASLTIQTTPEEAQKVIDFIKKFQDHPPMFQIPTSDCTTACEEALRILGIDIDKWTPDGLWAELYAMYSSEAMKGREKLGNPFFAPVGVPAQPGHEYGNPRFSGSGFDYNSFLFNLLLNQRSRPIKACVTVQGPNGPETTCDN